MTRPHDHVEQALIAPRYLAGGGDPAWITVPLHRACHWSFGHDPLMPRVHLTSPDQQAMLRIDPDPDEPWWTIRHTRSGDQPAWSATFGARTPVEILAAFTDALTVPGPRHGAAADPYEPLNQAKWRPCDEGDALTSPDGIVRVEHITDSGSTCWFIETAVSEDPEGLIWRASVDGRTPAHLITALTRALADETPLPRDPQRLPVLGRHQVSARARQVPVESVAFALEHRVAHLAERHTASTASRPAPSPRPPQVPGPRRTR